MPLTSLGIESIGLKAEADSGCVLSCWLEIDEGFGPGLLVGSKTHIGGLSGMLSLKGKESYSGSLGTGEHWADVETTIFGRHLCAFGLSF